MSAVSIKITNHTLLAAKLSGDVAVLLTLLLVNLHLFRLKVKDGHAQSTDDQIR
jgi:hypothetical protein